MRRVQYWPLERQISSLTKVIIIINGSTNDELDLGRSFAFFSTTILYIIFFSMRTTQLAHPNLFFGLF
jgi:hypothetical protein